MNSNSRRSELRPWTLWDQNLNQHFGGAFKTEEGARRWRAAAGLSAHLVPVRFAELHQEHSQR